MTASELLAQITHSGGQVRLEGGRLKYRLPNGRTDLVDALREHKALLIEHLEANSDGVLKKPVPQSIPRLPAFLEQLVCAASGDALPPGPVKLETGIVADFKLYVLAWASAYLTGDQDHALERLHVGHKAWMTSKKTN